MADTLLARRLAVVGLLCVACMCQSDELSAEEPKAEKPWMPPVKNVPFPTMGGRQFWADELLFHSWRIQRNVITHHCRLLDENNLRHASGSYEKCLAVLQDVKRKRKLPPMEGRAVVLLHGLARSRSSMAKLSKQLQDAGFSVFDVGYPSTRRGVSDHARALAGIIDNLDGIEEINFVGYSLGNIVIRHYLADQTDEESGRRPDPRIKRFVMIGPPNHGSIAATSFADNQLFATIAGKAGQQLGPEWVWLESDLATPQCEFGIVAGGLGNEQGFNPLLPGDDDGIVTLVSTRLAGASDFSLVPVWHSFLSTDSRVIKRTLCFLQNGYFVSAQSRQPVGDGTED